jgi:hypothetical protein
MVDWQQMLVQELLYCFLQNAHTKADVTRLGQFGLMTNLAIDSNVESRKNHPCQELSKEELVRLHKHN